MNIRPADDDDFDAIKAVARVTWHDTYDELDEELIDRTVDDWYTDDSMPLEAPGTVVLVVEDERGEIVGFTHAVAQGDTADILRMYVEPDAQGEGVGTDLHERLVEQLEAYDVDRIRSFDFAFNDASRRFYEGLGFEQTDTGEVTIEGSTYDEAVYTLEL
ncbi:GNAT family N-acetyltransferase [Natronolimnohabitans innermongolicus]|uniref:N-acetyltransferase GCN5 n=1 Tax=Natronolimnohabitans innermongolicus JCM 12255 TaxID=1227499 RepID=L9WZX3_9EURY|nr:GNAT family N-acetyltransferase [Natronolimnohabitans innermongolicus]ELY54751.1 N-acetyltransferase GCN5 [Natronolimnohabitans innermongolicus JCM 12255]